MALRALLLANTVSSFIRRTSLRHALGVVMKCFADIYNPVPVTKILVDVPTGTDHASLRLV
jgi:hypothetical protein